MVDIPDTSDPLTRKLGRKPAHFNKQAMQSAIAMDAALRALGPPPASSRDYLAAVTSPWGMLLNDQLGDCVCADTGHALMLRTSNSTKATVIPTDDDILKLYETVGGYVPGEADTDGGCNESDMCHYLVQNGFLGHKANSTGHVEPLHTDNLKWCVELFGTCRVGINLPQSALDQNAAGQIWDVKGDSTIVGGHDVPLVKYECDTLICLTWAKPQPMTLEFAKKYIDEAHSELFYDWIMEQGTAPSGFSLNDLSQRLLAIQY
jgi:hypothetical protein